MAFSLFFMNLTLFIIYLNTYCFYQASEMLEAKSLHLSALMEGILYLPVKIQMFTYGIIIA